VLLAPYLGYDAPTPGRIRWLASPDIPRIIGLLALPCRRHPLLRRPAGAGVAVPPNSEKKICARLYRSADAELPTHRITEPISPPRPGRVTIISGADDELMLANKYEEAVRGVSRTVDVKLIDGSTTWASSAAPAAVSVIADDVAPAGRRELSHDGEPDIGGDAASGARMFCIFVGLVQLLRPKRGQVIVRAVTPSSMRCWSPRHGALLYRFTGQFQRAPRWRDREPDLHRDGDWCRCCATRVQRTGSTTTTTGSHGRMSALCRPARPSLCTAGPAHDARAGLGRNICRHDGGFLRSLYSDRKESAKPGQGSTPAGAIQHEGAPHDRQPRGLRGACRHHDMVGRVRQSRIYDLAKPNDVDVGVLVFAGYLVTYLVPPYAVIGWVSVYVIA